MTHGLLPRYIFWRCLPLPAMTDSRRGLPQLLRNMCSRYRVSQFRADKPQKSPSHRRDQREDQELPPDGDDLLLAKMECGIFRKVRGLPPASRRSTLLAY